MKTNYEAFTLALEMDADEAARIITLYVEPDLLMLPGEPAPFIEPVRVQAAFIVAGWAEQYGMEPTIH